MHFFIPHGTIGSSVLLHHPFGPSTVSMVLALNMFYLLLLFFLRYAGCTPWPVTISFLQLTRFVGSFAPHPVNRVLWYSVFSFSLPAEGDFLVLVPAEGLNNLILLKFINPNLLNFTYPDMSFGSREIGNGSFWSSCCVGYRKWFGWGPSLCLHWFAIMYANLPAEDLMRLNPMLSMAYTALKLMNFDLPFGFPEIDTGLTSANFDLWCVWWLDCLICLLLVRLTLSAALLPHKSGALNYTLALTLSIIVVILIMLIMGRLTSMMNLCLECSWLDILGHINKTIKQIVPKWVYPWQDFDRTSFYTTALINLCFFETINFGQINFFIICLSSSVGEIWISLWLATFSLLTFSRMIYFVTLVASWLIHIGFLWVPLAPSDSYWYALLLSKITSHSHLSFWLYLWFVGCDIYRWLDQQTFCSVFPTCWFCLVSLSARDFCYEMIIYTITCLTGDLLRCTICLSFFGYETAVLHSQICRIFAPVTSQLWALFFVFLFFPFLVLLSFVFYCGVRNPIFVNVLCWLRNPLSVRLRKSISYPNLE